MNINIFQCIVDSVYVEVVARNNLWLKLTVRCSYDPIIIRCDNIPYEKYKDGNNRPSSVNQISLIHNYDKAGNKCYTQDNTPSV